VASLGHVFSLLGGGGLPRQAAPAAVLHVYLQDVQKDGAIGGGEVLQALRALPMAAAGGRVYRAGFSGT
jgi:hypothetical protein